jgi:hypothetical protein
LLLFPLSVEQSALEMSGVFAAKAANRHGITLFDDFQAVEVALFPRKLKIATSPRSP